MTLQPHHFPGTVTEIAARAGLTYQAAYGRMRPLRYINVIHVVDGVWFWEGPKP